MARVLMELGAELISSDAVAVYELVKNSIDAGSKTIHLDIDIVLQWSAYQELREDLLDADSDFEVASFLARLEELVEEDSNQEGREEFLSAFEGVGSRSKALEVLDEAYFQANSIVLKDLGTGMTAEALENCFLTIGTPNRLKQKEAVIIHNRDHKGGTQIPLGEKGIGRLAAMRLGHHVDVLTGVKGECTWSILDMDWRPIFENPDLRADDLDYQVEEADHAKGRETHGTTITVRAIQANWSPSKLKGLVEGEFAKLADPFNETLANQFLKIRYQGERVTIPAFESSKLKHADATCEAHFDYSAESEPGDKSGGANLSIEIAYKRFSKTKVRQISGVHLATALSYTPARKQKTKVENLLPDTDDVLGALKKVGPFDMKFYWFNRGRIQRENNTMWMDQLKSFVAGWSGGLLVYRDGYRVYPYGASADDWLDLDRKALAGSAYKLNRAQIVGYLRISTADNPFLKDQTNREGFRDCPEKEALRRLLRLIIIQECRVFLEDVDKNEKAQAEETVDDIDSRLTSSHDVVVRTLEGIRERVPEEHKAIQEALAQLAEVEDAWSRAKATIKSHEDELEQYFHLASVGLMVEFIAHELARSTDNALTMLTSKKGVKQGDLDMLAAQLKTIEKRVRVLDELSVPGRQRKKVVEMREVVEKLKNFHAAKMARHNIVFSITQSSKASFRQKVEEGQVLQILDNLFSNSFFWLTHQFLRSKPRAISINIDPSKLALTFTDNGPGVPEDLKDEIFNAFVTSKPPGQGRGLGLFISTKLANYNDATLELGSPDKDRKLNSFVLKFKSSDGA